MTRAKAARRARSTHGGARAGAGRPPMGAEPQVRVTVTLPAAQAAWLAASGNASLAVRVLIAQAMGR